MTKFRGEEREWQRERKLTGCHGLVSRPDLELVEVRSGMFTLFAGDCAGGCACA